MSKESQIEVIMGLWEKGVIDDEFANRMIDYWKLFIEPPPFVIKPTPP